MEESKREFFNADASKEKGDDREKSQVASEKPSSFDVIREAAKKTEEAEAKSSQDKAQQSDVGSSSDSSKIVKIPANFKQLGGNTELTKAEVLLLGEHHIPQHHKDIVDFINDHASSDDIVLVEGVQAGEELSKDQFAVWRQRVLREDVSRPLMKDVKMYGWDNMTVNHEQQDINHIFKELKKEYLINQTDDILEEIEDFEEKFRELSAMRDKKMLETINYIKDNFF
jgi:hypothetical protein